MSLEFDKNALDDLRYWVSINPKKAKKILQLVEEIVNNPFDGIGKPEPLKYDLHKAWSRRIDQEHRLVYIVESDKIRILACRYHYR